MNDTTKHVVDVAAAANAFAAFVGWLPSIAAALSIIWLGLQIWTWWRLKSWVKPTIAAKEK